jgi:hypothetical protein
MEAVEGRATRSQEKKRRLDAGLEDVPKKPKQQTLGQVLAEERENITQKLEGDERIASLKQYEVYDKHDILQRFNANDSNTLPGQLYQATPVDPQSDPLNIVFLTLQTGPFPKNLTHFCNNTSLRWHIKGLNIHTNVTIFSPIPTVVALFVRGEHVQGTAIDGEGFLFVGLVGVQAVSSGSNEDNRFVYYDVRFVFDYSLSKKELAIFGDNVMKCKKNRYGCSLCA